MNFIEAVKGVLKTPFYMGMIIITLFTGLLNLISPINKLWYFYTVPIWIILWALLDMWNTRDKNDKH